MLTVPELTPPMGSKKPEGLLAMLSHRAGDPELPSEMGCR